MTEVVQLHVVVASLNQILHDTAMNRLYEKDEKLSITITNLH